MKPLGLMSRVCLSDWSLSAVRQHSLTLSPSFHESYSDEMQLQQVTVSYFHTQTRTLCVSTCVRQVFDISLSIWLQALFRRCSKTSKDMEARHACVLKNEGRNANVTIFSFPSSHERKTYVFETREGGSLIQIVCHPSCIWKNFRFEFGLRM